MLRFPDAAHVQGVRMIWAVSLAILAGAAASALATRLGRRPVGVHHGGLPEASVDGHGTRPESADAGWDETRAATYRDHG